MSVIASVEDVVFKYFDASNNLEEVFGDTGIQGIMMNTIPEVFEIIIENSFGIEENSPNINDYIEGCELDFDVDSLSDIQINLMLTRINNVLNIFPTVNSKKYILQLYACATVRDIGYDWLTYIMYNSEYEIVDNTTHPLDNPQPRQ